MQDKILFSAVSGADPVSYHRDGPMLHICRVYRPRRVVLFLSQEMLGNQDTDDRYRWTLHQLGTLLGHDFSVEHLSPVDDREKVHLFGFFYDLFEEQLIRLHSENPGAEILVNITSGTPAMMAALESLGSMLSFPITKVQVSSPFRAQNPPMKPAVYCREEEWTQDLDNDAGQFEDRCRVVENRNYTVRLVRNTIYQYLDGCHYHAAVTAAESIRDFLPPKPVLLIKAAAARQDLRQDKVRRLLADELGEEELLPIFRPLPDGEPCTLFEYLLWLQARQEQGACGDFIRGITPALCHLLLQYVVTVLRVDLRRYLPHARDKNGVLWLTRKTLQTDEAGREILRQLDRSFGGKYHNAPLSPEILSKIIEWRCADKSVKQKVAELRDVERRARNPAAHTIVAVDDAWLKSTTGACAAQIMAKIREIAALTLGGGLDWGSYRGMNERIKRELAEAVKL